MGDVEAVIVKESETLEVPFTGETVLLEDEVACALAWEKLGEMERHLKAVKSVLVEAVAQRAQVLGTKTIALPGRRQVIEVRGGPRKVYDAEAIEADLRLLGAPEELIREIVKEEITHTVDARRAKRAGDVNEQYRAVIESHTSEIVTSTYLGIRSK